MSEIKALLSKHFPQLSEPKLVEEIASYGEIYSFRPGQVIMDYNSYIRMVPLIIEGSIKVTREDEVDGREVILYFLESGETCSMSFSCCLASKKSAIRTEALEETKVIGIPVQYVDSWMIKYQSWKNFIMQTYDAKLFEMVKVIDSIAFEGMDIRLFNYLKKRSEIIKSNTIHITHQEIAKDLNASREAVSRLLKKMENQGLVKLNRNQILIV